MSQSALLVLEDGTVLKGHGLGKPHEPVFGEVVFNTSMSGYQEILTDPSYAGQMVVLTHPHVGNYGVTAVDNESDRVQARALIVRELSEIPSNHRSESSLQAWLLEANVPIFWGLDTRSLTRRIRESGAMMGCLVVGATVEDAPRWLEVLRKQPSYGSHDYVAEVSVKSQRSVRLEQAEHGERVVEGQAEGPHVVVIDFGVKHSILKNLLKRGMQVTLVPNTMSIAQIATLNPQAVLLSNGPGDPVMLDERQAFLRELPQHWPTWGICLGHQLLARAFGGDTYKLRFGHRGPNQPVQYLPTGKVEMTSQNHGYAVSATLPSCLEVTHINLNDHTVEGFRHQELPVEAVQFHPEAGPGPHDAENFFDRFLVAMSGSRE